MTKPEDIRVKRQDKQESRWGRIHVPVIVLSAHHGWTSEAYRVYEALAILADPRTGAVLYPRSVISEASLTAKSTASKHLGAFQDTGLLTYTGKCGRTDTYLLTAHVEPSSLHKKALSLAPNLQKYLRQWGKLYSWVLDLSIRDKWTAGMHRTHLACTCFANGKTGEFWPSLRTIAAVSGNPRTSVERHISKFLERGILVSNGKHGQSRCYLLSVSPTWSDTSEEPETLASNAQDDDSRDRYLWPRVLCSDEGQQIRSTSRDRPSTQDMTGSTAPKSQKPGHHRSRSSENRDTLKPPPELHLHDEIAESATDRTDLINSSRTERTEKTDLLEEPGPVSRTGGEREKSDSISSSSYAAVNKNGERIENEQMVNRASGKPSPTVSQDTSISGTGASDQGTVAITNSGHLKYSVPTNDGLSSSDPVQEEWRRAYEEASQSSPDEIQAIFNAILTMFRQRPEKCGKYSEAYHDHEEAANHMAMYLDKEHGWKLFKKADEQAKHNYLGWCLTMAKKRGQWNPQRRARHHATMPKKPEERLYENPEERLAAMEKREAKLILSKYGQQVEQSQEVQKQGIYSHLKHVVDDVLEEILPQEHEFNGLETDDGNIPLSDVLFFLENPLYGVHSIEHLDILREMVRGGSFGESLKPAAENYWGWGALCVLWRSDECTEGTWAFG